MSIKPLVSVIIIFLNAEKFIQEAIESVFAQTYEHWELILVDDGSTDESTDIALSYIERYPGRVSYLDHEDHDNRGMSASRNLGIHQSKGKYIAILDSDDVWLPHKLEQQVAILDFHPEAAMTYGNFQFWYSWTGKPEDSQHDRVLELGVQLDTLIKPPKLLIHYYPLGEIHPPCISSILIRRETVERIGGFEEAFGLIPRGLCDDLPFFLKVHLKESVFVSGKCLVKYRQHPDSAVSVVKKVGQFHSAELFFLNWMEDYLINQDIKDPAVLEVFRKVLSSYRHPIANQTKKEAKCLLNRILVLILRFKRSVLGGKTGSIIASPNPIRIQAPERFAVGVTTLSWTSVGTKIVEVHVGSPDGPLFTRSKPSGSATTGLWVRNGMVFYLQDASGKIPFTFANTLDAVKVRVISTVS